MSARGRSKGNRISHKAVRRPLVLPRKANTAFVLSQTKDRRPASRAAVLPFSLVGAHIMRPRNAGGSPAFRYSGSRESQYPSPAPPFARGIIQYPRDTPVI
ncbi:hypothetical protein CE91St43_23310 [Oscillospiraceae bacterium]|nr:hypothetical protein CE91St43_23310 [Oscillospiraceae bacterium]